MTRVGLRPRHRDRGPSLRAILRRPSRVEVNVLRLVSSTAHSADDEAALLGAAAPMAVRLGPAMQKRALLLTQNTSRQQAVTPRFGGRLLNVVVLGEGVVVGRKEEGGCDWRRTRTTSRGVTVGYSTVSKVPNGKGLALQLREKDRVLYQEGR